MESVGASLGAGAVFVGWFIPPETVSLPMASSIGLYHSGYLSAVVRSSLTLVLSPPLPESSISKALESGTPGSLASRSSLSLRDLEGSQAKGYLGYIFVCFSIQRDITQ
jgi:hypothetical protein